MKDNEIKRVVKRTVKKSSINTTRILVVIFIVISFLLAIGGAVYISELKMCFEKEKDLLNKELIKTQTEKLEAEKNTSICKSDIPGWRKDFFTSTSVATTSDWNYFEKIDSDEKISFSMEYPDDWRRSENRFYENKHGVEEVHVMTFNSQLVKLKSEQKCFDKKSYGEFIYINEQGEEQSRLLKEEEISINDMYGSLRFKKNKYLGDETFTYIHSYCLVKDENAIQIYFSTKSEAYVNRDFYEKILSTIKFEE